MTKVKNAYSTQSEHHKRMLGQDLNPYIPRLKPVGFTGCPINDILKSVNETVRLPKILVMAHIVFEESGHIVPYSPKNACTSRLFVIKLSVTKECAYKTPPAGATTPTDG